MEWILMKRRQFMQAVAATAVPYALVHGGSARAQVTCSPPYVRKEFRTLTSSEWSAFVAAVKCTNFDLLGLFRPTVYDSFTHKFRENITAPDADTANGFNGPARQRKFLADFEKKLKEADPSVSLPYWNVTADAQYPEQSTLFSPAYMGGNGRPLFGDAVLDGSFAGWQVGYSDLPNRPIVPHTLQRHFNGNGHINPFPSPEEVADAIQVSPTVDEFRQKMLRILGLAANGIGGDMSSPFTAPNDPIFWLVKCYIDKLYSDWLQLHPEAPQPDAVCYSYA
jgi:tyrosinase